jgi:predicted RNA-binding protein YlqC (UPF0109 family)
MEPRETAVLVAGEEDSVTSMLRNLIGPLVGSPDRLTISAVRNGELVSFHVGLAAADFERVIGPEGCTAESLSVIVRAAGIKAHRAFTLVLQQAH